jgi:superfamily II RNA helicase
MSTESHISRSPIGSDDRNDASGAEQQGDSNNGLGDDWINAWHVDLYDDWHVEQYDNSLNEEIASPPVDVDGTTSTLAGTVIDGGRLKHIDISETCSTSTVGKMRSSVSDAFEHRNQNLQLGFQRKSWQIAAASELLLGLDVMVVTGTGSGKSMCYLLTVMAKLDGIVMVLSPLLSLMEDQVRSHP